MPPSTTNPDIVVHDVQQVVITQEQFTTLLNQTLAISTIRKLLNLSPEAGVVPGVPFYCSILKVFETLESNQAISFSIPYLLRVLNDKATQEELRAEIIALSEVLANIPQMRAHIIYLLGALGIDYHSLQQ